MGDGALGSAVGAALREAAAGVAGPAALRALEEQGSSEPPTEEVALPVVQAYAEVAGRIEDYNAAFNSRHFEQLMALFDQVRAQLDEEDVELLLLAA